MLRENDDMDELLRKAADNYPLKTDNADWKKVRSDLVAKGMSNAPTKNKNRRSLWLLLLLPLGWAVYYYIPLTDTSYQNITTKGEINKSSQSITQNIIAERGEKANVKNLNQSSISNAGTLQYISQKNKHSKNIKPNAKFSIIATDQSSPGKQTK